MWESGGYYVSISPTPPILGGPPEAGFSATRERAKRFVSRHYIQTKRASVETSTLKVEVHIPFGRFMGTALPLNVLVGAVVEDFEGLVEELVLDTGTGVTVEVLVAVLATVDELTWAQ